MFGQFTLIIFLECYNFGWVAISRYEYSMSTTFSKYLNFRYTTTDKANVFHFEFRTNEIAFDKCSFFFAFISMFTAVEISTQISRKRKNIRKMQSHHQKWNFIKSEHFNVYSIFITIFSCENFSKEFNFQVVSLVNTLYGCQLFYLQHLKHSKTK